MHPLNQLLSTLAPQSEPVTHPTHPGREAVADGRGGGAAVVAVMTGEVGGVAPAAHPAGGWLVSPGLTMLAIQDPRRRDGAAGEIHFGPNLSLSDRKRLVASLEHWDRVDLQNQK